MKKLKKNKSTTAQANHYILLSIEEVKEMLGYKDNSSIYKLMKKQGFPKQIKISPKKVVWRKSEIMEWIDSRETGVV